ncbi:MAG: type II and III secretion system protein family protein [Planctomycetes bacterium]|nr:type II and III secretion system protein family protein [Planctomycetota bacterium]
MMRGHLCGWPAAVLVVMGLCGMVSAQTGAAADQITLIAGRSTVVRAPWPTVRVAVTDPTIAGVQVLTPEQVLVQGLKVGSTDLILWSEDQKETWQRRIVVKLDLEKIQVSLQRLFPTAELTISDSGEVLLVQGLLRRADEVVQLKEYLDKSKIPYVNMTSLAGLQQVQLQVRVAEVSRIALRQLGFNFVGTNNNFFYGQKVGGVTPSIDIGPAGQTFPPESLNDLVFATPGSGITAGSSVTLFGGFPGSNFEFYLKALAENQYMRILANPTLVALSGEEANFLAGGEFPIPVPQTSGGGSSNAITIQYKQFGVLLAFQPVVLGDGTIRLRASQEVSELSDAGAVVIQGFSVPALTTRRAEATLELNSGQSFAMAGLLRTTDAAVSSRIPGLGDLPILGPLFRSTQYKNQQTELVILVTAALVEPMSVATAPPLPGAAFAEPNDWEFYIEGRIEGKGPAKIDPAGRKWLKDMGLDQLAGPGAWDTYEEQTYPELARTAEAQPAEKKVDKPAKPAAAPLLGSPEGQAAVTTRSPEKKSDAPQP